MSHVTGFGVHVKVASIQKSREFYEGYLGLTPIFAYGSEDFRAALPHGVTSVPERYQGVTYEIPGGAKIEIADGHIAVADPLVFDSRLESPKVSAMLNVDSIASLLNESSIRPKSPVKHYYWGTLEMVVRDPDGWVVVLIAPFAESEKDAIAAIVPVETVGPSQ